jgi:secreted trypsin-like serine protease
MKFNLPSAALFAVLAAPLSAYALVGGAGSSAPAANSPWAGVGSLSVNGSLFTATLIAPGYVLTAAHVAAGADPTKMSFQLNGGSSFAVAASQVFVNPGYTGNTNGNVLNDPTNHADLAIIKLASDVPVGVSAYSLFTGNMQNKDLSFVSYAGSTTSMTTGENMADSLFKDSAGTAQTYLFDFDGPDVSTNYLGGGTLGANREASFVQGDSGSAAFVSVNGQWQLAGINTYQAFFTGGSQTSGAYGTGGGGVVLSSYLPWITSVTAVPEPSEWLMLLAGMGLIGGLQRRRRVCA